MNNALQSGILAPQGPIAAAERTILLNATLIMLAVIVPVIIGTLIFAWWFRAGNGKAKYLPGWSYSGRIELVVWSIPTLIVLFLGGIAWVGSHDVDPFKPFASDQKPIEVQVISMDWKWLFIYPADGIASINELTIPTGRPIHFSLTSSSVMNSFFVPQLGSQIYTMAGMVTQVSLQADRPGEFTGISAQFSGAGFSDMTFTVKSVSDDDFNGWIASVRQSGSPLDKAAYVQLEQAKSTASPKTFSSTEEGLFDAAVGAFQSRVNQVHQLSSTPAHLEMH